MRQWASAGDGTRDIDDPRWWVSNWGGVLSEAGVHVSAESSRRVPVVQACVEAITEPLATLPLQVVRQSTDERGRSSVAPLHRHWLQRLMDERPNTDDTAVEFWTALGDDLLQYGNALALIVPGKSAPIAQLVRVPWTDVREVRRDRETGWRWFVFSHPWTGAREVRRADEVWHLRDGAAHPSWPGCGEGRVQLGRDTIGQALALQLYTAWYFRNAGTGGIVEADWADMDSARRFMAEFRRARSGRNSWMDVALPKSAKYHPAAVNNQHGQVVELRRELKAEITQLYGVPPHRAGVLDRATNNNIEQQGLEYIAHVVRPRAVLFQSSIRRHLLQERDVHALFDLTQLSLMDAAARASYFSAAVQWGWRSRNEVRGLEGLPPVEGLDAYERPLNMERVSSRSAEPRAVARLSHGGSNWLRTAAGVILPNHQER